jgi:hypothetical protein
MFVRLWHKDSPLSPADAKRILKLGFTKSDEMRMDELAEKNSAGSLTPEEREELRDYVELGDLLAIAQSKARRILKNYSN